MNIFDEIKNEIKLNFPKGTINKKLDEMKNEFNSKDFENLDFKDIKNYYDNYLSTIETYIENYSMDRVELFNYFGDYIVKSEHYMTILKSANEDISKIKENELSTLNSLKLVFNLSKSEKRDFINHIEKNYKNLTKTKEDICIK